MKYFPLLNYILRVLIANYNGPITSNVSTVTTRSFRVLRRTLSRAEVRISGNKTRQIMAYISELVNVFIVIAGNQVIIQCAPDKDYEKLVYHKLIEYVKSRGFNSDFGPKIMKRRNPLQPMLTVEA